MGKTKAIKVPVTERALLQRINRNLAEDDDVVKKPRRPDQNLGEFYRVDTKINGIVDTHVDLEALGRELGVLAPWEALGLPECKGGK